MSKKEKSIELLNKAVNDELLAVHQYMYFHFRCDDMGFDLVSNLFKRIAIQEMMHVEKLAERILFLKGEVEMKVAGEVRKLTEVKDMLEQAVKMEMNSVDDYNKWANECAANADSVSKKLFETLTAEEEVHQDQFETELDNLEKFGDNDTLSSVVAALIGEDLLILMSDIDGLFTDDPNSNPDARFIDIVENMDDNMRKLGKSSTGSNVGTGGMATKLTAAIIATAAGADMVIANGNDFHNIHRIVEGKNCGTLFVGNKKEEFFLIDYIEKLL